MTVFSHLHCRAGTSPLQLVYRRVKFLRLGIACLLAKLSVPS